MDTVDLDDGSLKLIGLTVATAVALVFILWSFVTRPKNVPSKRTVAILVLGDIGRSPRMMYHAESFAKHNFETYLIGYGGSRPVPSLLTIPHVHIIHLSEVPRSFKRLPFLLLAPFKIMSQVYTIMYTLFYRIPSPPCYLMVQNPPSIPTLMLVWLTCKLRGSKLIIDWHNLGYSILALRLGENHILVRLAKWLEKTFGQEAYVHLFVTKAMHDFLVKEWHLRGIKAVLHDRPPTNFHRATAFEAHDLFLRLRSAFIKEGLEPFLPRVEDNSTPFTILSSTPSSHDSIVATAQAMDSMYTLSSEECPVFRVDRPALLVSSTSWTPDEDFDLLMGAIELYEERARHVNEDSASGRPRLPKVLLLVTGKGPLKERYMVKIRNSEKDWRWIRCRSLWLEAEDYPLLLGSADLGICLHASSSALDLPMKIVDMFGCGLPVCALNFRCLPELVIGNRNGLIFNNSHELVDQFELLLENFPRTPMLDALRSSLDRTSKEARPPPLLSSSALLQGAHLTAGGDWEWSTWTENWDKVVKPLVVH